MQRGVDAKRQRGKEEKTMHPYIYASLHLKSFRYLIKPRVFDFKLS